MSAPVPPPEEPSLQDVLDGIAADGDYGEFEPRQRPLIDDLGRVRLSFSRIDTHEKCPLKFRFRYLDKLPSVMAGHLSFGTSIHSALESFHERTLFGMPTVDDLLGFLFDGWESAGYADVSREEQLTQYRRAQDALRRYHARTAATYRPAAATEAWFELPVGDRALVVGSIDRIDIDDDGTFHVVDYKTGRLRGEQYVLGSLQLAIYALACEHLFGRLPATVALDYVVAGTPVIVEVADMDLDDARARVLACADAVVADEFPATPNRLCNWCDYRDACPAWEGKGPQLLGPTVARIDELRRRVGREVAELRQLEAVLPELAEAVADVPRPVAIRNDGEVPTHADADATATVAPPTSKDT